MDAISLAAVMQRILLSAETFEGKFAESALNIAA